MRNQTKDKKISGSDRMMQQMAKNERDENCSIGLESKAILPVMVSFGLPVFPVILPAPVRGLNAPEKTAPHPGFVPGPS